MESGHFYFFNDDYFIDFPDDNLMKNKETINGQVHGRPSFYAFQDPKTLLYWMIPISSQLPKFKKLYNEKTANGKPCDTIVFGDLLGHEKAFLIQNMCPILPKYIDNEYIDARINIPAKINGALEKDIIQKAKKILALVRHGNAFLIKPDVLKIEKELLDSIMI